MLTLCVDPNPANDCRQPGVEACDEHFAWLIDGVPCGACIFNGGQNEGGFSRDGTRYVHKNYDDGPGALDDDGDGKLDVLYYTYDIANRQLRIDHLEDDVNVGTFTFPALPTTQGEVFDAAQNLLNTTGNQNRRRRMLLAVDSARRCERAYGSAQRRVRPNRYSRDLGIEIGVEGDAVRSGFDTRILPANDDELDRRLTLGCRGELLRHRVRPARSSSTTTATSRSTARWPPSSRAARHVGRGFSHDRAVLGRRGHASRARGHVRQRTVDGRPRSA